MPTPPLSRPRRGLFVRVAVLSTLLVILSVGPCAYLFLRQHRAAGWDALKSHASAVAGSVANFAAEHSHENVAKYCEQLFANSDLLDCVVVAIGGREPYAQEHRRGHWEQAHDPTIWLPRADATATVSMTEEVSPATGQRVLLCRCPIKAGPSLRGWVHLGLSITSWETALAAGIRTTIITVLLAALAGIGGAFYRTGGAGGYDNAARHPAHPQGGHFTRSHT